MPQSLVIRGVVLLVVLILGVFIFLTMIRLLVDIAEGWGLSFVVNELGVAHFTPEFACKC